jgi:hypothetical protein
MPRIIYDRPVKEGNCVTDSSGMNCGGDYRYESSDWSPMWGYNHLCIGIPTKKPKTIHQIQKEKSGPVKSYFATNDQIKIMLDNGKVGENNA